MVLDRKWFTFASVNVAIAIACGAFGAHSLQTKVDPRMLEVWKTSSQYHLIMSLGLILILLAIPVLTNQKRASFALKLVAAGTVVFSLSLYLLVLTGAKWLGMITPIGGVLLISGWLILATSNSIIKTSVS